MDKKPDFEPNFWNNRVFGGSRNIWNHSANWNFSVLKRYLSFFYEITICFKDGNAKETFREESNSYDF